jgi:hypothetical protein
VSAPEKRLPFAELTGMAGGARPAKAKLGQGGAARCAKARWPRTGWVAARLMVGWPEVKKKVLYCALIYGSVD